MKFKIIIQLFFTFVMCIPHLCLAGLNVNNTTLLTSETQKDYKSLVQKKEYTLSTNTAWNNSQTQYTNVSLNSMNDNNEYINIKDHKYTKVKTISKDRYMASVVLGAVVGFGTGHAVQNRYTNKGWFFTVSELGCVAIFIQLIPSILESRAGEIAGYLTVFSFVALKIFELGDLLWPPSNYEVSSHKKESNFYITPSFYSLNHSSQKTVGLSFGFKW